MKNGSGRISSITLNKYTQLVSLTLIISLKPVRAFSADYQKL